MSYEKQTWNKYDELKTEEENIENGAVVTDNRMNHMESGIGDNDTNLASHLANTNNPHKVTAAQVGLGNVQNFGLATEDEAKQGTNNAKYMTPSLTQAVLSANINSIAYANSADGTDGFTTVYPNLNLLDGTRGFSGTWTNSSSWVTDGTYKGLTVKKQTAQWNGIYKTFTAPKDGTYTFSAYIKSSGNTANVYRYGGVNTTSSQPIVQKQIGNNFDWTRDSVTLNLKANDSVWIRYEISGAGTDSVLWVAGYKYEQGSTATPYMPSASEVTTADWPSYIGFSNTVKTNKSASDYAWFPVKDSELTNKVDSHVNNKANPHSVTASQVGAYSKDESDQKLAAQKQAIDSHVNNKSNPHAVTASQVGAYSKQEIDTKLSKAVMADDSGKVTVKTLQVETIKSNSDTDLLNLSLTGVASATFSYIRINGIVYITAAGNWGNFPDNKQRIVGNIPAGFRPPADWGTGMNPQGGSRLLSAVIKANGDLGVTSDAAQNNVYGQFSMSYPVI